MSTVSRVGTYLPCWGSAAARELGDDEDAVTLAVAAGRAALGDDSHDSQVGHVNEVVFVCRDFPLMEGGNSAALLAGLGLADDVPVRETIGGAPAALEAVAAASDGILVIGVDTGRRADGSAGASAILCAPNGATLTSLGRVTRSMPVTTRDGSGIRGDYADPRLLRERGLAESMSRLGEPKPTVIAGLARRDATTWCVGSPPALPTLGASATGFAVAALAEQGLTGPLLAAEQATLSLAELAGGPISVSRDEPAARPRPDGKLTPGSSLPISLPAYDRAFDAKLRFEAARCTICGTLSYPPRYRCLECGAEGSTEAAALPRQAEIYSLATIRVPVPGLVSPYTVVIAELGDTGVRTLVRLTGAPPGSVQIGDHGRLVFRLVAVRSGVPDYGFAFQPDHTAQEAAT